MAIVLFAPEVARADQNHSEHGAAIILDAMTRFRIAAPLNLRVAEKVVAGAIARGACPAELDEAGNDVVGHVEATDLRAEVEFRARR